MAWTARALSFGVASASSGINLVRGSSKPIIVPFASGKKTFYKRIARDSGAPAGSGPVYVTWVATVPNASYPNPLPYGGPLVESQLLSVWQET